MTMSNKVYDVLKWIAQYFLPAGCTLYAALAKIWGFPYGEEVVGTLAAIDVFLGALLGISSANYAGDGILQIDSSDPDMDGYNFVLTTPLEDLPKKSTIMLKIDPDADLSDESQD